LCPSSVCVVATFPGTTSKHSRIPSKGRSGPTQYENKARLDGQRTYKIKLKNEFND